MRSLNQVQIIGNLTRDPEMRYTPQGNAVTSFGVATNREWVKDGEKSEAVDFHNIVAWGKLAEICSQYLKKGSKIYVSGRLQTRSWEDDRGKHYKTEIVANDVIFLTPKSQTAEPMTTDTYSPPDTERVSPRPTGDPLEDFTGEVDENITPKEVDEMMGKKKLPWEEETAKKDLTKQKE